MDKQQALKLKETLLKEKAEIESELSHIAKRNPDIKGDWKAVPSDISDPADTLDEKAQTVTNFEERRALEQNFELRLREIDETLRKLETGNYGICINCSLPIDAKRLLVIPAVQRCFNCASNSSIA